MFFTIFHDFKFVFSSHTRLCSVFQLTIKVKGSTDARILGMLHVKGVMLLKEFDCLNSERPDNLELSQKYILETFNPYRGELRDLASTPHGLNSNGTNDFCACRS